LIVCPILYFLKQIFALVKEIRSASSATKVSDNFAFLEFLATNVDKRVHETSRASAANDSKDPYQSNSVVSADYTATGRNNREVLIPVQQQLDTESAVAAAVDNATKKIKLRKNREKEHSSLDHSSQQPYPRSLPVLSTNPSRMYVLFLLLYHCL
jgi:C1A family cysteine protease